ncbi:hypothetical protein BMG_6552 (plasmid) [Priestia megaterium]|nr:hypothetical protein BMG_6552 [Priestia megaterium]
MKNYQKRLFYISAKVQKHFMNVRYFTYTFTNNFWLKPDIKIS